MLDKGAVFAIGLGSHDSDMLERRAASNSDVYGFSLTQGEIIMLEAIGKE